MNCIISGLGEQEEEFREQIEDMLRNKYERMNSLSEVMEFKAHFKKHHDTGTKAKHSVKLHLFSKLGDFSAEANDWEIMNALHESLRKLEVEFKHKKDRMA